jgi:hypothetical protein
MHASQIAERLPARPARDGDWRDAAACADEPHPDRWVDLPPVRVRGKNNPDYDARVAELRQTCATCPVFDHCLWEALDMNVRGVFAGMDEFDRADVRDLLNLPTPPMIPPPENDEDARLIEQQFAALRLARKGYTNTEIADELHVSPMTVSRLTASEERPSERRHKKHHRDTIFDDTLYGTLDPAEDDTVAAEDFPSDTDEPTADDTDNTEGGTHTTSDEFDCFGSALTMPLPGRYASA